MKLSLRIRSMRQQREANAPRRRESRPYKPSVHLVSYYQLPESRAERSAKRRRMLVLLSALLAVCIFAASTLELAPRAVQCGAPVGRMM